MNSPRTMMLIATLILSKEMAIGQQGQAERDSGANSWNLHFQQTIVTQGHFQFSAAYSGTNSLKTAGETKTSITSTLFFGTMLWSGGELYVNPEMSGGEGISGALGVAGFPNGETFRIGNVTPTVFPARVYIKQTIALTEAKHVIARDINQLGGLAAVQRLSIIIGKFGLADFFDQNLYSHDSRTQFLNWALMNNGAWDYAADTRGYTWGIFGEYSESDWSLRAAAALEPKSANGLEMDTRFTKAFSVNMEFERRYEWRGHDGALRFLFYRNQAHMGNYDRAISDSISQRDIARTRLDGRTKYGLGLNWEQHVTDNGGMFVRLGWSDGVNETWAYTEIDRTFSLGGILGGQGWNRPLDHVGMSGVINALSRDHLRYLAAGGTGFLLGDGRLRYGPEMIVETFYSALIIEWMTLTADYQFIGNPAYNRDRGPVHVFGLRMHTEL